MWGWAGRDRPGPQMIPLPGGCSLLASGLFSGWGVMLAPVVLTNHSTYHAKDMAVFRPMWVTTNDWGSCNALSLWPSPDRATGQ